MGKRTSYDPYDHFMLRAPLFPLELLLSIPNSQDQLFHWLRKLWSDPLIREGITLGSPEFSQRIEIEFDDGNIQRPDQALLFSMLRYICRFSSRCTPFGTFAGFSIGTIGSGTILKLGPGTDHQLHARPDMEYLMRVARMLETDPVIREKLIYTCNTSIYLVGSGYHYMEVKFPEGKLKKVYDIVTIDDGGVIGLILEFCRTGRTLGEVRDFLESEGWETKEVRDFVDSLVSSQVLVSNLEPVICGIEYLECMVELLKQESVNSEIIGALTEMKDLFGVMSKPSSVLSHLVMLDSIIDKIPIKLNRNHLIQVDMKLIGNPMTVDAQVTGQVLLGLRILKSFSSASHYDILTGFRESFVKRYGDRKVSLLKALDPETGIGLEGSVEGYWTDPAPWIDDLAWGPLQGGGSAEFSPGNPWLSAKLYHAIRDQETYLTLESKDIQSIGLHDGAWSNQMTAMVELFYTDTPGELNIHLIHGAAGNPAFLLGRFGFADPDCTREWIQQLIDDEMSADPDSVFAEVVHLPEDRTGNILQRPSFLDFEIPYLARSVKAADCQIPVADLQISVENQKLVLSSATSGKRVRPCMTNAYNHQLGHIAVYKFLHRISFQEPGQYFRPDWGNALSLAPYIPGIRFKNIIIAPPIWLVVCDDLAKWILPERNEISMPELTAWKNERKMPDEMMWIAADQELYFSWSNPNLLFALWDSIRTLKQIRLRPFYLSKGTPVSGQDGSHANQFIFCFRKS